MRHASATTCGYYRQRYPSKILITSFLVVALLEGCAAKLEVGSSVAGDEAGIESLDLSPSYQYVTKTLAVPKDHIVSESIGVALCSRADFLRKRPFFYDSIGEGENRNAFPDVGQKLLWFVRVPIRSSLVGLVLAVDPQTGQVVGHEKYYIFE